MYIRARAVQLDEQLVIRWEVRLDEEGFNLQAEVQVSTPQLSKTELKRAARAGAAADREIEGSNGGHTES